MFWVSGVALSLLTAFNQKLAQRAVEGWNGISPWWTIAIVGAFAVFRMAVNNFEAFEALQKRVVTDEEKIAQRTRIREGVSDLIAQAKFYERCCLERDNAGNLGELVQAFDRKVQQFLEYEIEDQSFLNLFLFASEHDYQLTASDIEYMQFEDPGTNYQGWLRKLRAQRRLLEQCLEQFPMLRP